MQGWTITRVHEGWSGSEIYTLLQAFRAHVIEYIYGSDGVFAASVHAQFPGAERSFFLSVFVVGAVSANATRPLWQLGGSIACRCSLCYGICILNAGVWMVHLPCRQSGRRDYRDDALVDEPVCVGDGYKGVPQ